jgi:hypothetical protein
MGGRDRELPTSPSLDEYMRALIRDEVAKEVARVMEVKERSDPDEILSPKQLAKETGYSAGAVNLWCRQNLIPGAYHKGLKGRWRIPRRGWNTFLETCKRRPLKRMGTA